MKIQVTQADIEESKRRYALNPKIAVHNMCPVACALQRITGNPRWQASYSFVCCYDQRGPVSLPFEVALRMQDYDRAGIMVPFEFELYL
jgi:hypothetical protein